MGGGGRSSSGGAGGGAINRPVEQPRSQIVDTSDLNGKMLRSVLLDLHAIQESEISGIREERDSVIEMSNSAGDEANRLADEIDGFLGNNSIMYSQDYEVQPGTPEAEEPSYKRRVENEEKYRELDRKRRESMKANLELSEKASKLHEEMLKKEKEQKEKQKSIFYVGTQNQISLDLDITKGTELYKYKDKMQEQANFIEKLWVPYHSLTDKKIKIHAKGKAGGGGAQIPGTINVEIGLNRVYDTTAMHEFAHSIEDQMGVSHARKEKAKKIILKRTKQKNIEDVEVKKQVSYVDSKGKEHYSSSVRGEPIYIPKGIFTDVNEESRSGYMFRVYGHDVEERNGKKYIRRDPSHYIGIEMPSVGVERIYNEPVKFAKEYPDIFEIVVDTFRKK